MGPLPDAKYYDSNGMKPECEKQVVFNMEEELLKYCRSDVDILRRCYLNFAKTAKGLCKINPFEHCITITSLYNLIFRTMFLKKETIAGERRVGPYFLDGCRKNTHTSYEFHRCFYHGCPKCFPADTVNPFSCFTMQKLYEGTQVKTNFFKQQGWQVVEMWECEFHDFLQRNTVAKTYVDSLKDIVDPLNSRDAFYGGRVKCHQIAGKDTSEPYHKNQVREFYQPLPGHQQERCVTYGSPHHFHGEYSP